MFKVFKFNGCESWLYSRKNYDISIVKKDNKYYGQLYRIIDEGESATLIGEKVFENIIDAKLYFTDLMEQCINNNKEIL